ncbi:cobalt ECF transporter T component CbiQ [Anaerolineales bacterium HSG6]|nr:cobalt ECF transporter T component CbiQ [Anaerolineales bacterium HSG6]
MNRLGLDEYAHLDSPIHRWEIRAKLVGLIALIFAFSVGQVLLLIPVMVGLTVGLFLLSRLPLSYLIKRLKAPGYFLLLMVIVLPFASGSTVLWTLGPLSIKQEGLTNLLLIVSRFICIITVSLILFGSAPFLETIKAMRALGLPPILADMMLLTYRYLFEISEQLTTMRTAIRLRGFRVMTLSYCNLSVLAALIGSLLIRSYEQSERVYQAMILRGYGQGIIATDTFHTNPFDMFLTTLTLCFAAGFVGLNLWLG